MSTLGDVIVAHGIGRIRDLPIPGFFFLYGGGAVVLLSFAALGALWLEPLLERAPSVQLPPRLPRLLLCRGLRFVLRALTVSFFLLVVVAAFAGARDRNANLAPLSIWVLFWLALVPVTLLLGNVWAVVSPFRAVAGLARRPRLAYPKRLGRWPPAAPPLALRALGLRDPEPPPP